MTADGCVFLAAGEWRYSTKKSSRVLDKKRHCLGVNGLAEDRPGSLTCVDACCVL